MTSTVDYRDAYFHYGTVFLFAPPAILAFIFAGAGIGGLLNNGAIGALVGVVAALATIAGLIWVHRRWGDLFDYSYLALCALVPAGMVFAASSGDVLERLPVAGGIGLLAGAIMFGFLRVLNRRESSATDIYFHHDLPEDR